MFANRLVADGERVALAGVELTVRDLGPGESPSASVWILGARVFVGDLAYSDVHPYLLEPDPPRGWRSSTEHEACSPTDRRYCRATASAEDWSCSTAGGFTSETLRQRRYWATRGWTAG